MLPTTETPKSLAARFRDGDDSALAEIYERFSQPMLVAAMSVVGDRDLAAEAVQQAFVQAWRASAAFDDTRELQPWLYAITRRTAIDAHRRRNRTSTHVSLEQVRDSVGVVDPPSLDHAWEKWQIHQALHRLPADEQTVLRLVYFAGLSHSEVSRKLGTPLGTVKSRTARAHRRLARLLTHLQDDPHDAGTPSYGDSLSPPRQRLLAR